MCCDLLLIEFQSAFIFLQMKSGTRYVEIKNKYNKKRLSDKSMIGQLKVSNSNGNKTSSYASSSLGKYDNSMLMRVHTFLITPRTLVYNEHFSRGGKLCSKLSDFRKFQYFNLCVYNAIHEIIRQILQFQV